MLLGRDRFRVRKRCSSPRSLAAHANVKPDPGKSKAGVQSSPPECGTWHGPTQGCITAGPARHAVMWASGKALPRAIAPPGAWQVGSPSPACAGSGGAGRAQPTCWVPEVGLHGAGLAAAQCLQAPAQRLQLLLQPRVLRVEEAALLHSFTEVLQELRHPARAQHHHGFRDRDGGMGTPPTEPWAGTSPSGAWASSAACLGHCCPRTCPCQHTESTMPGVHRRAPAP